MRNISYFLLFLVLLLTSCKKEEYGELIGTVKNEYGQPLSGAKIKIDIFTTTTDYNGTYHFPAIPEGGYIISAAIGSYLDSVQQVSIRAHRVNVVDFILKTGETSLQISDSLLEIDSPGGYRDIDIITNASWTLENGCEWVECSDTNGTGNAKVRISWQENNGSAWRSDTLYVRSGSISRPIIVRQDYLMRLLTCKGILGNGQSGIPDSVLVLFNKPISLDRIESNWQGCQSEIHYTMVESNYGVEFSYPCGTLGREYPFTVYVRDAKGTDLRFIFSVPFYDRKIETEGYIVDFILTEDGSHCWVATYNPDKLLYVSTDSLKTEKTFNLNFAPKQVVLNPYNQLLYLSAGVLNITPPSNRLYVLDPASGIRLKTIVINPEADDHPQQPVVYPIRFGFSKTGYGVITLMDISASGHRWRIIDSAKEDTLYRHESFDIFDGFRNVHTNYDQTKLLITSGDHPKLLTIVNGTTHDVSTVLPDVTSKCMFIVPNRKNNTVFMGEDHGQFIMDLDGNIGKILTIPNTYEFSADFSYRQDDNNIVYLCDKQIFWLLDYNQPSVLMSCDANYQMRGFTTSPDGTCAFAYTQDFPSQFIKFRTSDFYRHVSL